MAGTGPSRVNFTAAIPRPTEEKNLTPTAENENAKGHASQAAEAGKHWTSAIVKLRRMTAEEHVLHMPDVPIDRAYIGVDAEGRSVSTYQWLYSEEQ